MSSNGINLLVDRRNVRPLAPLKRRLRIFRLSAIAILFGVGAASVILSVLILLSPLPQLKRDEQKARDDLAAYRIDINKLAFINDRGDGIRQIISKRSSYDKKLDVIESKMPAGVSFDGLTIVRKNYTLRFSSTNLASLNELLDSIVSITGTARGRDFSRVYLTSLSTDEEKMRFVLVIDLLTV
jgi:hypothetical protein